MLYYYTFLFILVTVVSVQCKFHFSTDEIKLKMGTNQTILATFNNFHDVNTKYKLLNEFPDLLKVYPEIIETNATEIKLDGIKAGKSDLYAVIFSSEMNNSAHLVTKIYKSDSVEVLSNTVGWLYFLAWSVSFYPQLYINYKRKSVVGLNFDFLSFNIVGYFAYNTFNVGLYFIPAVQKEFSRIHPTALIPIQANDIFFSAHGIFATLATIMQCFIYERGNQKVSTLAKIILGFYFVSIISSAILAGFGVFLWLDVLYLCSYIKLCVTVTKYMPQAFMNYKRKCTNGWSIGGIILDFVGGNLSIFQMVLDGYNYDDWETILENPTKFGLGMLTIGFDVMFAVQHYCLYNKSVEKQKKDIEMVDI